MQPRVRFGVFVVVLASLLLASSTTIALAQTPSFGGSVSLSASRTTTDPYTTTSLLTATTSAAVPYGYSLAIYDQSGTRRTSCMGNASITSCSVSVSPALNTSETYTAYVAQSVPSTGAPSGDVHASPSVTVNRVGYLGTVSLSASRTTTDPYTTTSLLTATTSAAVPYGYSLAIYDQAGTKRTSCSGNASITTCSVSVSPALNTSETYTAYVAQSVPSTGSPSGDVHASPSVTVNRVGYLGTVSLSASRTTTDPYTTTSLLTATTSAAVPYGYSLAIYDQAGTKRTSCSGNASITTCSVSVSPALNTSETYTAYVAQWVPSTGSPSGDVRASSSVTVNRVGYLGTVSLSASRTTTDPYNSSSTLTATASAGVPYGYSLAIYDQSGTRRTSCMGNTSITSCSVSVSPALNTSETYTAYVAQTVPSTGSPSGDVRASSSVTVNRVGYLGTVSLSASRTTTDPYNSSSTLTATTSAAVPYGYSLAIYDQAGTRRTSCQGNASLTSCSVTVAPALGTSETFTAHVAQTLPSSGSPSGDAHSSPSVTVSRVGYLGTVSLSASRTTTDPYNSSSTLTATASAAVPYGYSLAIYDQAGTRRTSCQGNASLTSCSVSVSPALNTSETYTAYVAQSVPSTGAPSGDVHASANVTVNRVGYVGSVTLTATRQVVDPNSPASTLTASTSASVPYGYSLAIYDQAGTRRTSCSGGVNVTSCGLSVFPALNTAETFTAYVAQTVPSSGAPSGDVHASGSVTVHSVGFTGLVTLTTTRTEVTDANPSATLTAETRQQVPYGYSLAIYDQAGTRRASCPGGWAVRTCGLSVAPTGGVTEVFTAYVAQVAPSSGSPSGDVVRSRQVSVTDVRLTGSVNLNVDGYNLEVYVAALAMVDLEEICDPFLASPTAPGSTVPPAYTTCDRLKRYGLRALLAGLAAGGGYALLDELMEGHNGSTTQNPPAPACPVVEPCEPSPPSPAPAPTLPFPYLPDEIDAPIMQALEGRPGGKPTDVAVATRHCRKLTADAHMANVGGKHPCQMLPIFLPGQDVFSAAQHKRQAIEGRPDWTLLHYVSRTTKLETGYTPGNEVSDSRCPSPRPTGMACDEAPYFATAEGGVPSGGSSSAISLKLIDATENSRDGGFYRAFTSATSITGCALEHNQAFLLIPTVPADENAPRSGPDTGWWCGAAA